MSYKGEELFSAEPKNKAIRDFLLCAPDTSKFLVRLAKRSKYLDIMKFSIDSGYHVFVEAVRNHDPQDILANYFIDMSEIKSKKELYYPDGTWMR